MECGGGWTDLVVVGGGWARRHLRRRIHLTEKGGGGFGCFSVGWGRGLTVFFLGGPVSGGFSWFRVFFCWPGGVGSAGY